MEQERTHEHPHSGHPQYPHEPGVRYTANGWAIKKQLNYGDIIGLVTLAVMIGIPLMVWATGQSEKTVVNEQRIVAQDQKNAQQDQRIDRLESRTDRSFRALEGKIDKLNENIIHLIRQQRTGPKD